MIIKKTIEHKSKVIVMDDEEDEVKHLPKTKAVCPKCEHGEAHWFMRQTRAADEPPTIFYTCAKCNHKWRSYG